MHDDSLADVLLELSLAASAFGEVLLDLGHRVATFAERCGEEHDELVKTTSDLEVVDA